MLADADQRDLWSYCRLRELDIPYVLVTRADFEPTKKRDGSPARPTWRRFYYSSAVRTFDDLWIQPPAEVRLLRATFRPNGTRGARPKQEHLIAAEEKDRCNFLTVPEPVLNEFVIAKVEAWFAAHRWPEAAQVA